MSKSIINTFNKLAEINVLMCGPRRVGKTCIMSAMKSNLQNLIPTGEIAMVMDDASELLAFEQRQRNIFTDTRWESPFYHAETSDHLGKDGASTASATLRDFTSLLSVRSGQRNLKTARIRFTDPRGEDFTDPRKHDEMIERIRNSHIILMVVDAPHLMEDDDKGIPRGYHEIYNLAGHITDMIKAAWQKNNIPRMVLFVPVKCEKYIRENRMEELLENLRLGYVDLLQYITANQRSMCTVAVAPCQTMGGLEFRKFAPHVEGQPPHNGSKMLWDSLYSFIRDPLTNARNYAPKDCEQPLMYVLQFVFRMNMRRNVFGKMMAFLNHLPSEAELMNAADCVAAKLRREKKDGFCVLYDPMEIF